MTVATKLTLKVLENEFAIHRLDPDNDPLPGVFGGRFYSVTRTDDGLSIVCEADHPIDSARVSSGWSCVQVVGPLDFSLTGILAGIATTLANKKISLFAISTYETDYFLVRKRDLSGALSALKDAGYVIA